MRSPYEMFSFKAFGLGAAIVAVTAIAAQPYRPMVVMGESMAPTYANHQILWTKPVEGPLHRGDVVVVDTPDGPFVKRIVFLGGDRRFQWRAMSGWSDMTTLIPPKHTRGRVRSIAVPVGTAYVLGDNLGKSTDSRNFGPVALSSIRRIVVGARLPDKMSSVRYEAPTQWIAAGVAAGQQRSASRVQPTNL